MPVGLPNWLSKLQARIFGALPKKIFTMDNYLFLQADSLSEENSCADLGITPRCLKSVIEPLLTNSDRAETKISPFV